MNRIDDHFVSLKIKVKHSIMTMFDQSSLKCSILCDKNMKNTVTEFNLCDRNMKNTVT